MNIRFIIHCTDTQIQKKITAQTKESIITHRIHIILWIVFFYTRLPLILPFVKCNLDSPLVTFSIIEVVFLWTGLSYSGGIIWMAIGSSKRGGLPFWYCGWSSSLLSGRLPANIIIKILLKYTLASPIKIFFRQTKFENKY